MDKSKKKLLILGILLELSFLLFFFVEPLRKLFGDTELILDNEFVFFLVRSLMLVALGIYIISVFHLKKESTGHIKMLLLFAFIFNLTLLFVWPMKSTDLFTYIYRSRIITVYHENPYLIPYDNFPNDILYERIHNNWSGNTNIYGPVFTYMTATLNFIGGDNLYLNIILFKLLAIVGSLASGWLIYKFTKNELATILYLWNPYILFEFAVDGHNDSLQIFFLFTALYYLFSSSFTKDHLKGWAIFLLSVLIKFFSLLFFPFIFFYSFFKISKDKRLKFLLFFSLLSILLTILLYLPIWEGTAIFSRLKYLALEHKSMWLSPGIQISTALLQYLKVDGFFTWSIMANRIILGFCLIGLFVFYIKKKSFSYTHNVILFSIIAFTLCLLLYFTWLLPWYFSTLFALLALHFGYTGNNYSRLIIIVLSLYLVIMYFPFQATIF